MVIYMKGDKLIDILKNGKFKSSVKLTEESYEYLIEQKFDFIEFEERNKGCKIKIIK